jgi:hypothetical protein
MDFTVKLARSPAVEECFARHALRYWLGRLENQGDGCTVMTARDAYLQSGGDPIALFASVFSSESFLYRTPAQN